MTATGKLDWIKARIAEGRKVYLTTHLKSTVITAETVEWALKVSGDSLYCKRGKSWDCCDYVKISAR